MRAAPGRRAQQSDDGCGRVCLLLLLGALGGVACGTGESPPRLDLLREVFSDGECVQVFGEGRHDPAAYTQGLVARSGWLYESTGLTGQSRVTKQARSSTQVTGRFVYPPREFGEGLTWIQGGLLAFTWRGGVAYRLDEDLKLMATVPHGLGEVWGATAWRGQVVVSDGSSVLRFLDATSLEVQRRLEVRERGVPVDSLNELEAVGDLILANVLSFPGDGLVAIDPVSGELEGRAGLGCLAAQERQAARADGMRPSEWLVPNGIAWDEERGELLLTGKLWSHIYTLRVAQR